jgi:hypothetical protein
MANQAKLTVRVTHNRSGSTVQFSTTGRYFGLTTGGYNRTVQGLPVYSNSDAAVFWAAVAAEVAANLTATPTPP